MYYIGVDIGSSSSKVVILGPDGAILGKGSVQQGIGSGSAQTLLDDLKEGCGISSEACLTGVTGYGRNHFPAADFQMSEVSCHSTGAAALLPGVRTVIDIGGQDYKVMRVDQSGRVLEFAMNDKCAAGTGRFLDVMSRVLGVDVSELSRLDEMARDTVSIGNTCTVFAESEVISRLAEGAALTDIAAGIHRTVARKVAGLARRIGVEVPVAFTGGVAMNRGIKRALEEELEVTVLVPELPQLAGAYGAALYAFRDHGNR